MPRARRAGDEIGMSKFSDDDAADQDPEPPPRPEVQYILVGTLIGAILLLIFLSGVAPM